MAETIEADARRSTWDSIKPYFEKESLASFFLGVSSGFPFALLAATLTTRLAQDGIDKKTVTAFTLAFLVYNLKPLWAWVVDGVHIPLLGRLGQRVSWMLVAGVLVGAFIGWALDKGLGISPWGMIVFLLLGFAAGVVNVMRAAGVSSPPGSRQ